MYFDLLFFPLAALKSLADLIVGPLIPTLRAGHACVFRLASEKNTCVNFAHHAVDAERNPALENYIFQMA